MKETKVNTNLGLFEPTVMFFGLTNSPATFQTMMNYLLRDLIAQGKVAVYLDDILIFTKDLLEHRKIVKEVFTDITRKQTISETSKMRIRERRKYLGMIIKSVWTPQKSQQ
jgi:hypothetical protein